MIIANFRSMGYKCFKYGKLVLLFYILFISCNNSEDLTLGSNFIDNTTRIFQVDTFTVELSTVKMDSIITSLNEEALVGYCEDGELGKITATYFTQISLPLNRTLSEEDEYDSITIVMPYNSYFYGDTTVEQKVDIFLLKEKMTLVDDYYYNTNELEYENTPIGSYEFEPRPIRDSVIEFRIDDALGEDLFNKLLYEEEEVQTNEEFQEYIYGLAIVCDNSQSSSIIGYSRSGISLKLYSAKIEESEFGYYEQVIYEFNCDGYHFNKIESDRRGTVLEQISDQEENLSSNLTNSKTYIQAGTGILTKVNFPYLNSILFDSDNITLSAELIIKPANESYIGEFPDNLSAYLTYDNNNFDINNTDNILSTSEFVLDEMYHENTYYTFDLTEYIDVQISNGYFDNDLGLLLTIPSPNFSSTVERLIVSAEQDTDRRPILRITYLEN